MMRPSVRFGPAPIPWIMMVLWVSFAALRAPAADELAVEEADLPRFPPLSPEASLAAISVAPGFRVEIAAAEPEIVDPVAVAFDESGALFVVEMRDYSERRAEKLSRVKRLVDRDGDGRYETGTVFLDGLPWATGIACWDGGVFVAASPDILFARDTTGDGVADETEVVFSGFAAGRASPNVQALVNSLSFGPDNRIWGATAGNGGHVAGVRLDGADFAFDPMSRALTRESGTAQYGLTFDAGGRRFVCSNSHHLQWVAYENPHASHPLARPAAVLVDSPVDGAAAEVFRLSPEEPWRVVRTNWRASGVLSGIVEGGGRASGYFTSASGLVVYTGDLMPSLTGQVFIGDVGSNLVHRKHLRETPEGPVAERDEAESQSEFLASRDTWFRPVASANGPDGALYVVDMYREVIEHPDSLPPMLKRRLDLNSGNDRGRLYRVLPAASKPRRNGRMPVRDPAALAALTSHPNGWHRSTARRLIVGRQDARAIPKLRELSSFDAFAALDGLKAIELGDLRRALASSDEAVVRLGVQLLEKRPGLLPALTQETTRLLDHPSPAVRRQWALALRFLPAENRLQQLVHLQQGARSSRLLQDAIRMAVTSGAEGLSLLRSLPEPDIELVSMIGRDASSPAVAETAHWLRTTIVDAPALLFSLTAALGSPDAMSTLAPQAQQLASDAAQKIETRVAAARLLVAGGNEPYIKCLHHLFIDPATPEPVRAAAWPAVDASLAAQVWEAWPNLNAALRDRVVDRAVAQKAWHRPLLGALASGQISMTELSVSQTQQLRASADPDIKALAWTTLGPPPPDRQSVIAARLPVLRLHGDPAVGETIFRQRCLTCHRHGSEGAEIGPDRITFHHLGKPTLLAAILDPNREVAPQYYSASVTTTQGESWQGLLLRDDSNGVQLRLVGGETIDLNRQHIASFERLTRSLMPEGLEAGLTDAEMAGLLEFLQQ